MLKLTTLLLFIMAALYIPELLHEYRLQLKADDLYNKGAYSQAENTLRQLSSTRPKERETMTSTFNLGCSIYMQKRYSEAAALFAKKADHTSIDREVTEKSTFNEGNALAMSALHTTEPTSKTALFLASLKCFKLVLLKNPNDGDAKINYEIVSRYLHELQKPQHSSSKESAKRSNNLPSSAFNSNITDRLLQNAQQDESSLMQQLPRTGTNAEQGSTNNQDW